MKDMHGKLMEFGQIIAVRYVWNSYVGELQITGLESTGANRHKFFNAQQISKTATYQVLGHTDPNHPDFNQEVFDWYKSNDLECPVKITVYDHPTQ